MNIYVITKEGVYTTAAVLAVRETEDAAITAAKHFAMLDKDARHTYCVELFDTNAMPALSIADIYSGENVGEMIGYATKNMAVNSKPLWKEL